MKLLSWFKIEIGVLLLTLLVFSAWSYSLTDPNLVLSKATLFVAWQEWWWGLRGRWSEVSAAYIGLLALWYILYFHLAKRLSRTHMFFLLAVMIGVLLLGHNALSHDIFNYIFNARMVVEYSSDPHLHTALEFSYDPWTRFMHNIHTSAPYGYGWTALSLFPYFLGLKIFLLTFLAMRLLMVGGLVLLYFFVWKLLQVLKVKNFEKKFWLFAANPLLLTEVVLNGHNDVWMMWPIMAAFWIIFSRKIDWKSILLIVSLVVFSISIKYATVLLLPVLALLILTRILKKKHEIPWAELSVLLMLIPLFTDRSQQFLPWYLIWSWSFFPFLKRKAVKAALLGLSVSSLLRYVPWMLNGLEYNDELQVQMRMVTWVGGAIFAMLFFIVPKMRAAESANG